MAWLKKTSRLETAVALSSSCKPTLWPITSVPIMWTPPLLPVACTPIPVNVDAVACPQILIAFDSHLGPPPNLDASPDDALHENVIDRDRVAQRAEIDASTRAGRAWADHDVLEERLGQPGREVQSCEVSWLRRAVGFDDELVQG